MATEALSKAEAFFRNLGISEKLPEVSDTKDFYAQLIRGVLNAESIQKGRVLCTFIVKPSITNLYNTLHGGFVAALAEAVGLACAKTVAGDKEMFLGESNTSYLSAARLDVEVEVEGMVLRQGRSVVVTSVEFRIKKTRQLVYTSRSTFYVMPVASL